MTQDRKHKQQEKPAENFLLEPSKLFNKPEIDISEDFELLDEAIPFNDGISTINKEPVQGGDEDLFSFSSTDNIETTKEHVDDPLTETVSKASVADSDHNEMKRGSIDNSVTYQHLPNQENYSAEEGEEESLAFAMFDKHKASYKAMFPFLTISLLFLILAQFPSFLADVFFEKEQLDQLPEFLQSNMGNVLSGLLYIACLGFIYVAFKQISQGKLEVFDDYVRYKTGLFESTKILYVDLMSVAIHKSFQTNLFKLGDIELSSTTQEIRIKNVAHPQKIKEQILDKQKMFFKRKSFK